MKKTTTTKTTTTTTATSKKTISSFGVFALFFLTITAVESRFVRPNVETVTVNRGEMMRLVCKSEYDVKLCQFEKPDESLMVFFADAKFPNVKKIEDSPKDCAIEVSPVNEDDNGQWTCIVAANNPASGNTETASGYIDVVVAVAPETVALKTEGQSGSSIVKNLDDDALISVDCVAASARPKPEFVWYIGDDQVAGTTKDREENVQENGLRDFVQTLSFTAVPKHNGRSIKCVAKHQAYTAIDLGGKINEDSKRMDLTFKPIGKPKVLDFYSIKEGEKKDVTIKFDANPEPTSGSWKLFGVEAEIQFGSSSLDDAFTSSHIEKGDIEGEYLVTLTIKSFDPKMAGKINEMKVKNANGETIYRFKLELSDKPPSEPLGSGPIIGVVILVVFALLIIIVFVTARSKKILCFAPAKEDQLTAGEKDAAAFDNVEKGQEPLNPTNKDTKNPTNKDTKKANPSPDKKPEPATEEEKKSNGAHTPV